MRELILSCLRSADKADDPQAANEYDAAAELFASISGDCPASLAMLASVCAKRSMRLAQSDPARSSDHRARAEALFDTVEKSGDIFALGVVAFVLNELAENNDDAAMVRLDRVVGSLSTEQARLFRNAVARSQEQNSKRSA